MLWAIPLAGAALGALQAKRKGGSMLRGAATGGLLGAGAAYAAPALMGGAAGGAAGAGSYGAGAFGTAAGYGGTGAATMMPTAASSGGILGGLKTAAGYAQPAMQALQAATMAQGLLGGQDQGVQEPQMPIAQATGPQALAQLSQATDAQSQQNIAEMMKKRMANQQLIAQMMGRNYG